MWWWRCRARSGDFIKEFVFVADCIHEAKETVKQIMQDVYRKCVDDNIIIECTRHRSYKTALRG